MSIINYFFFANHLLHINIKHIIAIKKEETKNSQKMSDSNIDEDTRPNVPRIIFYNEVVYCDIQIFRDHASSIDYINKKRSENLRRLYITEDVLNQNERKVDFGINLNISSKVCIKISEIDMILRFSKHEELKDLSLFNIVGIEDENFDEYLKKKEATIKERIKTEELELQEKMDKDLKEAEMNNFFSNLVSRNEMSRLLNESIDDLKSKKEKEDLDYKKERKKTLLISLEHEKTNKTPIFLTNINTFYLGLHYRDYKKLNLKWLYDNVCFNKKKPGFSSKLEQLHVYLENNGPLIPDIDKKDHLRELKYAFDILLIFYMCENLTWMVFNCECNSFISYEYKDIPDAIILNSKLRVICMDVNNVSLYGWENPFLNRLKQLKNLEKFDMGGSFCDNQYDIDYFNIQDKRNFDTTTIKEQYNLDTPFPLQDLLKLPKLDVFEVRILTGPRSQIAYDSFIKAILKNKKLINLRYTPINPFPLNQNTKFNRLKSYLDIMFTNTKVKVIDLKLFLEFPLIPEQQEEYKRLLLIYDQKKFLNSNDKHKGEVERNQLYSLGGSINKRQKNFANGILMYIFQFMGDPPLVMTSQEEFDIWCEKETSIYVDKVIINRTLTDDLEIIRAFLNYKDKEGFPTDSEKRVNWCNEKKKLLRDKLKEILSKIHIGVQDGINIQINSMLELRYFKHHLQNTESLKNKHKYNISGLGNGYTIQRKLFDVFVLNNSRLLPLDKRYIPSNPLRFN